MSLRCIVMALVTLGVLLAPAGGMRASASVCPLTSPGGNPAVVANSGGRLELFLARDDGSVWHKWQTASGGWSGWHSLGSGFFCTIAVGRNSDGRLEVFTVTGGGAMSHRWQTSPGGGWSDWADLGGSLRATNHNLAVAANADGRLQVFAISDRIDIPDHVVTNWQRPGGGWFGWADLGGPVSTSPAVGRNQDGRLEVFAAYDDHAVYHAWQTSPNGGWSGLGSLGSPVLNPRFYAPAVFPAVGKNADGRLEIFVPAFTYPSQLDRALFRRYQTTPNGPAWSSWVNLGGATIWSVPSVASNADGRMEFFVIRDTDRSIWHRWQTAPNAGWSGWYVFGSDQPYSSYPVSIRNADGRLEVFAVGLSDNNVWHRWQRAPNAGWSGWYSLGHP
jgi:hypothetical protein